MINKPNYLMQFLGKAIWGGLVLIVSALLFAFVSVIVSTKVHDESMTIMIAFLIVGPFTAIVSLMGFNKIKQKVKELNNSNLLNHNNQGQLNRPSLLPAFADKPPSFSFSSKQVGWMIYLITFIFACIFAIHFFSPSSRFQCEGQTLINWIYCLNQ